MSFAPSAAEAIVVHDAQGRLVRKLDLGQFLPAAYVQALPRDGQGLHWWREAKLAGTGQSVDFSVALPGSAAGATGPALRFSIDLRDGRVRTAQIREYLVAADRAQSLAAATASTPRAPRLSPAVAVAGVSPRAASVSR